MDSTLIREGKTRDSTKLACDGCLRQGSSLMKCSRCGTVYYCSLDCQRKHWPAHKTICTEKKARIEAFDNNDCFLIINFLQDVLLGTTITLGDPRRPNTMNNSEAAIFGISNVVTTAMISDNIRKQMARAHGREGKTLCQALLAVLRMDGDNLEVQRIGLNAISKLSDNEEMRTELGEMGAIDVVTATLRKFIRDGVIVQGAFDSIGGLVLAHPNNNQKVIDPINTPDQHTPLTHPIYSSY